MMAAVSNKDVNDAYRLAFNDNNRGRGGEPPRVPLKSALCEH
jgi:hypothetical protein